MRLSSIFRCFGTFGNLTSCLSAIFGIYIFLPSVTVELPHGNILKKGQMKLNILKMKVKQNKQPHHHTHKDKVIVLKSRATNPIQITRCSAPVSIKTSYHQWLSKSLKTEGFFLITVFSKAN